MHLNLSLKWCDYFIFLFFVKENTNKKVACHFIAPLVMHFLPFLPFGQILRFANRAFFAFLILPFVLALFLPFWPFLRTFPVTGCRVRINRFLFTFFPRQLCGYKPLYIINMHDFEKSNIDFER